MGLLFRIWTSEQVLDGREKRPSPGSPATCGPQTQPEPCNNSTPAAADCRRRFQSLCVCRGVGGVSEFGSYVEGSKSLGSGANSEFLPELHHLPAGILEVNTRLLYASVSPSIHWGSHGDFTGTSVIKREKSLVQSTHTWTHKGHRSLWSSS